ncbi:YiiX/YebB-like N1pC/P60 family cysteine hydrolase [Pseudomonas idahonensis]|uniref:YiiX/YebB-like N1pC/P60 family cysteine hydrolase n=1 Tax=Pseudomonas idahonensis TaxID=2942628 RepID=UPI0030D1350E
MKKYILKPQLLQPGDIVCTRENNRTSKFIRNALTCEYSHVLLCVGPSSCIHADGEGVHSVNIQRMLANNALDFMVLRPKLERALTLEQTSKICSYARSKIGTEYSKIDATKSGVARKVRKKIKGLQSKYQFCSRLVAEAYEYGGVSFFTPASVCTPPDIFESDFFFALEDVAREASPEEIKFASDVSWDPINKQTNITNKIFQDAREITGSNIQTFQDLFLAAINTPEVDDQLATAILNSGYLTIWADDVLKNPWRYFKADFEIVSNLGAGGIDLALRESSMAKKDYKRFEEMRMSLVKDHKLTPRQSLKQHIVLYQLLISLARQRIELFEWVLTRERLRDSTS